MGRAAPQSRQQETVKPSHGSRCTLCARYYFHSLKKLVKLPQDFGAGPLPTTVLPQATERWRQLVCTEPVITGFICEKTCLQKLRKQCKLSAATAKTRTQLLEVASRSNDYVHKPKGPTWALTGEARARFDRVAVSDRCGAAQLRQTLPPPAAFEELDQRLSSMVSRPTDSAFRDQLWAIVAALLPPQPLRWVETIEGMGVGEYGPPLLAGSELSLLLADDNHDDARKKLLSTSDVSVLHEVIVQGHALDPITAQGCIAPGSSRSCLDHDVTQWRNELTYPTEQHGNLHQRYGWANPDCHSSRLLLHEANVPLLVHQQHESVPDAIAGETAAPVLMYGPSLAKILPEGHPGRVALEMLDPKDGASWMDCILPLAPDHALFGKTVGQVVRALGEDQAYGHGHGFERLVFSGTAGGNPSCIWLPTEPQRKGIKKKKKKKKKSGKKGMARPLLGGNGVLEYNDASMCCTIHTDGWSTVSHPGRLARDQCIPAWALLTGGLGKAKI